MAQTSWTQSLANFFKKKAIALSPVAYLEFSRQCLEEVRTMTSPRESKSSEVINYEQCVYLVDSLDRAVHKASFFLEHNRHQGGNSMSTEDGKESTLEHFKILCMLAKKVKCFIQGCCHGHWLHAGVMLSYLSNCTASLGFDLKLFTVLLPPYLDSRRYSPFPLTIREVSAWRNVEGELVKEMASNDEDRLFTKLRALIQFGQVSNDDLELATFLLERLHRFKQSSTPRSLELSLHERDLTSLEDLVKIGSGGYGTVHRASWLGIDVAVKTFNGTDNPDFKNEVPILAGLSHPNIVSFLCHGKDMGECFIVMELMDGDLFSLLKERLRKDRTRSSPFSVFEEFDVMLQIAEAMFYLHEMRVLHRDWKSHNILVRCMKSTNSQGYEYVQVKVSDFGLSRTKEFSMTQSRMTPNKGTTGWMAPELINYCNTNDIHDIGTAENEELLENYPFKCDVYSFGMVCLEILTGALPFPNMKANAVKRAVCAGERPPLPDRCHEKLKALIEKCWNPEPSSRPCFGDICTELRYLKSLHMTPAGLPVFQSLQNPSSQFESFEEMKTRKRKAQTDRQTDSWGPFLELSLGPTLSHVSTRGKLSSQNPVSQIATFEEKKVRKRDLETGISGPISDLSLGPTLSGVSSSGNLSSRRPLSSLRQNSFSLAFNPNLGDNATTGRPTPASESQGTWITTGIRTFAIDELRSLTSNFAEINILGRGERSVVYEGLLADYGKVAVKRMMGAMISPSVKFIQLRVAGWMSARHRHLVEMLGYCIDGNDLLLVNEYMSQGTLAQLLFKYQAINSEINPAKPLWWKWRLKIAMDVAEALEYLHGFDSIFPHFDFNSSNVLLDDDFNAKVSGFGFAQGSVPQGTGYSGDMEYSWARGRTKADHVYSFGVVLMELLSGRPAVNKGQDLVTLWRERRIPMGSAALDPHLGLGLSLHSDEYTTVKGISTVAELANLCTSDYPHFRPAMDEAVTVLRPLILSRDCLMQSGVKNLTYTEFINLEFFEALEYLHGLAYGFLQDCNLKSSLALLDDDFRAKVSDSGSPCWVLLNHNVPAPPDTWLPSTLARLSRKEIGVCSFGVVLMELLTGRPAVDENAGGEGQAPRQLV